MNVFHRSAALSLLLSAAFSAYAQPIAGEGTRPGGRVCQAQPAQFAVGQQLSDALIQDAQRRSGATRVRVKRPGEAYTMEYDEHRLNLEVDASERVIRVACG